MEKKINSYVDPMVTGPLCVQDIKDEDIVEYEVKQKAILQGDGKNPHDFIIEEDVVESSRINRDEYIQSFSKDVGIDNILKKVAISGDNSLLLQRKSLSTGDFRHEPKNNMEADDIVREAKKVADKVGIELKDDAIKAYIDEAIAKATAKKEEKIEGGAE